MRCLNSVLEDFYYCYAGLIHRYVYVFLIVPVVFTGLLGAGHYYQDRQTLNDSRFLFLPTDGYGKYEKQTFIDQFPLVQDDFVPGQNFDVQHYFTILITCKGCSDADRNATATKNSTYLFQKRALQLVDSLNQYILREHTFLSYDTPRRNLSYKDICLSSHGECFDNGHVTLLQMAVDGQRPLSYPITRFPTTGDAFYLGGVLGSVATDDRGHIRDVQAIRLIYFTKQSPEAYFYYGVQFRDTLTDYLVDVYKSDSIKVSFMHEQSINSGLSENAKRFKPEVGVTVLLVLMFSYVSSFTLLRTKNGLYIDWVRSKPLLAFFGTIEPGLAIISTQGFLLLIGCPYNEIVIVMPFLVFAIGVDDMFIMMSSWHNTDMSDPPEKRFAEALSEAGVAITITSVTDIIAFSVGTWNPLPSIQLYCYYTAVAMFFELLYQCTFYAAAVSLIGRAESKSLHCITWRKAKSTSEAKTKLQRRFCMGSVVNKISNKLSLMKQQASIENGAAKAVNGEFYASHFVADHDETTTTTADNEIIKDGNLTFAQRFFRKYYGPLLLKPITKLLVAVLFALYLAAAICGVMVMPQGLTPERLVPKDHYIYHYLKEKWLCGDGFPLAVLINNPPNISEYDERLKFYDFIDKLETTHHSMGANYTMLWLREYDGWLHKSYPNIPEEYLEFNKTYITQWLNSLFLSKSYWSSCIRWGNVSNGEDFNDIKAFRFSIGIKDFALPTDHQDAIVMFRRLLEEYPQYNITCFTEDSEYVDQYVIVYSITVRNTLVALAIMVFIAMMLIPHPVCGLFVILCVLSIDVGVSGFLSWWNVSMDIISMIGMIMATGFAVDFSAHISYAFVRATGTSNERAIKALETLGWPVFQGVSATLLGVLVMGTVDAYMFQVFFKTVFLVIILGLLHSIVFLPVALTGFMPAERFNKCVDRCSASSSSSSSSSTRNGSSRVDTPISEATVLQTLPNNAESDAE